jgi:hypothetical protein
MDQWNLKIPIQNPPSPPEGVKKLNFSPAYSGVKTGVQSVRKAPKMLDSGLRRNDVKGNQIDFFTPSPFLKGGFGGLLPFYFLAK